MTFTVCWAKNIDSVAHTYCGQQIQPNGTHQILDAERTKWANNSTVDDDICADKLRIGDGTEYFTDHDTQLNHLKMINVPVDSYSLPKGNIERRLYTSVSGSDTEQLDYVPANGAELQLREMGGDSSRSIDIKCEIIWDVGGTPEKLFCTHGDVPFQRTLRKLTGDGSKILRVLLTNDSEQTETLGAFWIGDID